MRYKYGDGHEVSPLMSPTLRSHPTAEEERTINSPLITRHSGQRSSRKIEDTSLSLEASTAYMWVHLLCAAGRLSYISNPRSPLRWKIPPLVSTLCAKGRVENILLQHIIAVSYVRVLERRVIPRGNTIRRQYRSTLGVIERDFNKNGAFESHGMYCKIMLRHCPTEVCGIKHPHLTVARHDSRIAWHPLPSAQMSVGSPSYRVCRHNEKERKTRFDGTICHGQDRHDTYIHEDDASQT